MNCGFSGSVPGSHLPVKNSTQFWDELAAHHAAIENSYFDLRSVRAILEEIESPVLVVGAGQGLIVEELIRRGFSCEGVDLSPQMIRYAEERRGLRLVNADAGSMPFHDGSYKTIIYATGVIDFMDDEEGIHRILREGRRVVQEGGKIFVGFYRLSGAIERFLGRAGLLRESVLDQKSSLETYLLSPAQFVGWVKDKTKTSTLGAMVELARLGIGTTWQEKRNTSRMQKIFRDRDAARKLIESAPRYQPYRNRAEIERLFGRLGIPARGFWMLSSCFVVEI